MNGDTVGLWSRRPPRAPLRLARRDTVRPWSRRRSRADAGGLPSRRASLGVVVATMLLSPHSGGLRGDDDAGDGLPADRARGRARRPALAPGSSPRRSRCSRSGTIFVPPKHGFDVDATRGRHQPRRLRARRADVCLVGASQARRAAARASAPSAGARRAAALHDVALARTHGRGRLRRRARRGPRAARRRRGPGRAADRRRQRRSRSSPRTASARTRSSDWRRFPLVAADADRRGHRDRPARLPRARASARAASPTAAAREPRPPRCRCASATRRSARSASASSAGTSSTTTSATFAVTLGEQCAYALERARVYDAERRSRGALGLLAAIGERLARSLEPDAALRHARRPRRADARRPVRRRPRRRATRCAGSSSSTPTPTCRRPRA